MSQAPTILSRVLDAVITHYGAVPDRLPSGGAKAIASELGLTVDQVVTALVTMRQPPAQRPCDVSIRGDLYARLARHARSAGRSVSALVEERLIAMLDEHERPAAPPTPKCQPMVAHAHTRRA